MTPVSRLETGNLLERSHAPSYRLTPRLTIANGLSVERLLQQPEEIAAINKQLSDSREPRHKSVRQERLPQVKDEVEAR
jgi:hypothetical protein